MDECRAPIQELLDAIVRDGRNAFWNAEHIDALREDLKKTPRALLSSMSVVGLRMGAAAFYRLPTWVMVPLLAGTWAAAHVWKITSDNDPSTLPMPCPFLWHEPDLTENVHRLESR